ncbi:hypothetical protein [Actinomadura sp. DC4]|uniref:hypothetical protein n=1 Tax=Actinomadura sp. DC4 TaxID=3055069 RepID=UPI0025B0D19F|nr:hypothetical protein [Actinomadura sp. DC4]MDN3352483.1 hypothetical protein [Actinomadura sp. DC4]
MRRQTLAVLIAVLALAPAACGGGGSKDPVAKAAASRSAEIGNQRKFAQCMRENGVNMSDPSGSGGATRIQVNGEPGKNGPEKLKAAEEKCRKFQPNGGKPVQLKPEELAKMRAMAKCMRANGVDMPDPDADGRITITGSGKNNPGPENPKFQAAQKACRQYAPKGAAGQQGGS